MKTLFSFLCLMMVSIHSFGMRSYDRQEFLVQTIPKGGTHLLNKALDNLREHGCPPRYRWAHFSQGQAYNTHRKIYPFLLNHPEKKAVVLVRDMRDVLVSLMFYLDKAVSPKADTDGSFVWFSVKPQSKEMNGWSQLRTVDEKLDYLLSPNTNYFARSEKVCADDSYAVAKREKTLVLRFEDLVGANGGGSDSKQLDSLVKLADHVCRKPPTKEQLSEVARKSFGGKTFKEGGHFRKGQIGEWRKYFKPRHVKRMKEIYNDYLLYYGYETSRNWE